MRIVQIRHWIPKTLCNGILVRTSADLGQLISGRSTTPIQLNRIGRNWREKTPKREFVAKSDCKTEFVGRESIRMRKRTIITWISNICWKVHGLGLVPECVVPLTDDSFIAF
ncbi:hypothetical protein MTP99_000055 [Tenebrio molitor]|nr:hypothetical protein MTP99_000055 [Tenebrio molitor]